MPPVTIVGLTWDQYKDLKPEYDKDRKAIFIKLEHTWWKYVGIQETKFNAWEGVEYPATIDGKKYKITLTPSADKKSLTVKADEIKESPLDAALSAIGYKKTGTDKYENGQLVLSISNSSTTLDKTGGSVNPDELNTVRKVLEAQKKTGKIFYNNGSASVRIQPV